MLTVLYRMHRRRSGETQGEAGFTMVELVIGIFIFALAIGGIVVGMSSSLNLTRQNRNRSIAANLASQEMDTVRSTDFVDLPLGMVTTTTSVDGVPYDVTRQTEWVTPSATSGACQAPSGSALAYLSVTVSVTWNNMAGVPAPSSHTVVTPPVGTYDTSRGHVAVIVRDAAGAPQEGVPVSLDGPGVSDSQVTTLDGCAFFAYEPTGTYTVTLNRPNYVDYQGTVAPVQSATIVPGSTVSLQFSYDQSASLSLTLAGGSGGVVPANIPVTLVNTHYLPAGQMLFAGSGASRTLLGLFPYVDGYEMYAGSCPDADPEGVNTSGGAIYTGASRPPATTVTAGGSSSATVPLHTILVQTQTLAGAARPNVAVTATSFIDSGCPTATAYPLGTTDAAGNFTAALPYGTWIISAAGTGATQTKLLSPLVSTTPTATIKW